MGALNRVLDRIIDPTTNKKLEMAIPLVHWTKVRAGDTVITLDEEALYELTGWSGHEKLRGYVFDVPKFPGTHVVPTYRPERIRKGGWHLASVMQRDVLRAVDVFRHGPPVPTHSYVTYPSPEEAVAFMAGWRPGDDPLAFDIETPYSGVKDENLTFDEDPSYTILLVSLSYQEHRAISLPWSPPFDEMVRRWLGMARRSLVWNAPFDVPRLQQNGVDFQGEVIDVMLAWHWLEPSLPMGLKFVAPFYCPEMPAWKLQMQENMAWYNAADSDTLLRCFQGIQKELVEQGRWTVFERHFLEYGKLLRKMQRRGVLVDRETRREDAEKFQEKLSELEEQVQPHVPTEVKPIHPKRGYKGDEESLRKKGSWVDGQMRRVVVELNDADILSAQKKLATKWNSEIKREVDMCHSEAKRYQKQLLKEEKQNARTK